MTRNKAMREALKRWGNYATVRVMTAYAADGLRDPITTYGVGIGATDDRGWGGSWEQAFQHADESEEQQERERMMDDKVIPDDRIPERSEGEGT